MAFALALATPLAAQNCGQAVPKVIGGEPAEAADWPGLAVLRLSDANSDVSVALCGATALSSKWVLTAAHCVKPKITTDSPYRRAVDGNIQIHDGVNGGRNIRNWALDVVPAADRFSEAAAMPGLAVVNVIVHEGFEYVGRVPKDNDIALIELADDTPWTGATMLLSTEALTDPPIDGAGSIMEVAGFGRTESFNFKSQTTVVGNKYFVSYTDRLQSAGMPSIDAEQCRTLNSINASLVGANQLCGGTFGIDSCGGDSGGPLSMCDAKYHRYQVGIVSWGSEYCGANDRYAGVYTRVSAYHDWILGHTGSLEVEAGPAPLAASRTLAEVESLLGEMQTLFKDDARVGELPLTVIRTDGTLIESGGANLLELGDRFAFRLTPPADGKLLLVEINPDFKVTQLFPNQYWSEGDEVVKGGQEVSVPVPRLHGFRAFQVQAPVGPHRVLALLLPPDYNLAEINRPDMGLEQADRSGFAGTGASVTYLATLLTEVADYLDSYSDVADRNFVAVPNLTMFAALEVFDVK
jgi:secreted trypsin-like serine protease